ncbi:MAG: alpha/beta hydrolase, partial [Pseudomonadota bacterium]|nr:alpha/beta hydrolase [Pseudomonadota bacterium]
MISLRARIVNLALPLLGIKRFFGEPEKMPERIAKLRRQKPIRPRAKWHREFTSREHADRGFALVTIEPPGGHRPGAPHLLYLHGGGYVMDIAAVHWDAVANLCERLGASASVPLYPLAPEHKAADTLAQMRALYLDLATLHGAANITV